MRRMIVLATLLGGFLLSLFAPASALAAKPNWLIIMLDDATQDHMQGKDQEDDWLFPRVYEDISKWVVFDKGRTLLSQCCPQRASFLTGMYPHNTGVLNNGGDFGGFDAFMNNGLDVVSFFNLMQGDYFTAYIGKYMNNYPKTNLPLVPEGFNYWYGLHNDGQSKMFNWSAIRTNGQRDFVSCAKDSCYQTNEMRDKAEFVINLQISRYGPKPFILVVSPFAPHNPAEPALKYAEHYATEPLGPAAKPSFNEANVSDKPPDVQATRLLTQGKIDRLTAEWRNVLRSGRSIDDLYERLRDQLLANGQLSNTCIAFISDNGYMRGEHRLTKKVRAYGASMNQVFFIRCPGAVPGTDHKLIGIHDLMPTILESAGIAIPATVDGRSFWGEITGNVVNTQREVLYVRGHPPADGEGGSFDESGMAFDTLAAKNWTYTVYDGGTVHEYYDLVADPDELVNIYSTLSAPYKAELDERLAALKVCAGWAECGPLEEAAFVETP